jgi:hypothetical protein
MTDLDQIENDDLNELEELQDKLLLEDEREREKPMSVEGRSVFELQRLKHKKKENDTHRSSSPN